MHQTLIVAAAPVAVQQAGQPPAKQSVLQALRAELLSAAAHADALASSFKRGCGCRCGSGSDFFLLLLLLFFLSELVAEAVQLWGQRVALGC